MSVPDLYTRSSTKGIWAVLHSEDRNEAQSLVLSWLAFLTMRLVYLGLVDLVFRHGLGLIVRDAAVNSLERCLGKKVD